jgi:hypothetical protein
MIAVGLLFSGVGFAYFRYGKKQNNIHLLITGLILMVYMYAIDSFMASIVIGALLSVLPFVMKWW